VNVTGGTTILKAICKGVVNGKRSAARRRQGLAQRLQCPKEYALFAANEGVRDHCEAGTREVLMFDWLDPIMTR
jgi:hypothetical protein